MIAGTVIFVVIVGSVVMTTLGGPSRWNLTDAQRKQDDRNQQAKLLDK